ncbi:MAG: hypothetical protein ACPG8W_18595, partial [Candidatus Promineifilaceae bacterium]
FRPIATVDPNQITLLPPTPISTPTTVKTPEPEHIQAARMLLENRPNLGEVGQTALFHQVIETQSDLRNLSFLITRAEETGAIDCDGVVNGYARLVDDSPVFIVSPAHSLTYFHYNRAVEGAVKHFSHLNQVCSMHIVDLAQNGEAMLSTELIIPQSAYLEAVDNQREISISVNQAVLWVNADDRVTSELYGRTRQLFQQLHSVVGNTPTTNECQTIVDGYHAISRFPQFSPNTDTYRYKAYLWYLEAVAKARETGEGLKGYCATYLDGSLTTSAADDNNIGITLTSASGQFLPEPDVQRALIGLSTSLGFIRKAIDSLVEPTPTPEPTPIPIRAQVIEARVGQRPYLWEVVVQILDVSGTPPYEALIGGFEMQPDGQIVIIHTCQLDFVDHIILVDSVGQLYLSQKLSANRPSHCFNQ